MSYKLQAIYMHRNTFNLQMKAVNKRFQWKFSTSLSSSTICTITLPSLAKIKNYLSLSLHPRLQHFRNRKKKKQMFAFAESRDSTEQRSRHCWPPLPPTYSERMGLSIARSCENHCLAAVLQVLLLHHQASTRLLLLSSWLLVKKSFQLESISAQLDERHWGGGVSVYSWQRSELKIEAWSIAVLYAFEALSWFSYLPLPLCTVTAF